MVAQQTNEFGIRMALGADRVRVIGLVLRQAFQRVAVGLVLGLPLAVGAVRRPDSGGPCCRHFADWSIAVLSPMRMVSV